MSDAHLNAAVCVKWPNGTGAGADTTGERNVVFRVANAASSTAIGSASTPIPPNARGRYWRMLTSGANCEFVFLLENGKAADGSALAADSRPTLVYGQTSTLGTGSAAAAPRLIDGAAEHIMCPDNAYAIEFISSAATGTFEASVSGRRTK